MEEKEIIQKSIKFPKELHDMIMKDASKENRDFSKQIIYMINKFYEIKNG